MKNTIAFFIAFIVVAMSLSAANYDNPILVDLNYAQSEIADLEEINERLDNDSSEKTSRKESLDAEISSIQDNLVTINTHLDALWAAAGTLHSMALNTADSETRRRLLNELETNQAQRYELEGMKATQYQEIAVKKQSCYVTNRRITKNTVDIKNNQERIDWFQRCIAFTEATYPDVDDIIVESQSLTEAVSDFLRQS
jgi:chromosome segregation ATPase